MAIYSATQYLYGITSGQATPIMDLVASAVSRPKITEWGITAINSSQSGSYGIGSPANDGSVVQAGAILLTPEDPTGPSGLSKTAIAWTVMPTIPTSFRRRGYLAQVQGGQGIVWTFPYGLGISPSMGMVLFNGLINIQNGWAQSWIVLEE